MFYMLTFLSKITQQYTIIKSLKEPINIIFSLKSIQKFIPDVTFENWSIFYIVITCITNDETVIRLWILHNSCYYHIIQGYVDITKIPLYDNYLYAITLVIFNVQILSTFHFIIANIILWFQFKNIIISSINLSLIINYQQIHRCNIEQNRIPIQCDKYTTTVTCVICKVWNKIIAIL